MPPEWAPHERTLMAWPCRRDLWGSELAAARREYAATANAIAAFEPLTMVCADAGDAAEARATLTAAVDIVELPIDDSWLRDNGPIFLLDGAGRRAGVHFGFNAWGGKFPPWERDAAVGDRLVELVGAELYSAPLVLEGGSIAVDGAGTLVATEQCLLNPNRNPTLDREAIERHLREYLGVERIVWLGRGMSEDRDTDGHVDMLAAFTPAGDLLLQSSPPGTPDHEPMLENRARAEAAGLRVIDFPCLAHATVAGESVLVAYMNSYVGERFAVAPLAGAATDEEALARLAAAYPGREVVGVPGTTIAYGGGGPHCITQQVPATAA